VVCEPRRREANQNVAAPASWSRNRPGWRIADARFAAGTPDDRVRFDHRWWPVAI